jgi:HNH endonuclease
MPRAKPTPEICLARFRERIRVMPSGCHEWTRGKLNTGYGVFYYMGRLQTTHRLAWKLAYGEIPKGFDVHHTCRNKACVNLAHLQLVTEADHIRLDGLAAAVNAAKTHCPRGHPYDEANTCRHNGKRYCRACARMKYHQKRARQRESSL